jgi:hypothetical protein
MQNVKPQQRVLAHELFREQKESRIRLPAWIIGTSVPGNIMTFANGPPAQPAASPSPCSIPP